MQSPAAIHLEDGCKAWHQREVGKWHAILSGTTWAEHAAVADSHHVDSAIWFPKISGLL